MSLSKFWKVLPLIAVLALAFSGCAGSKGSSEGGSEGGYSDEESEGASRSSGPKEDIDEDKLKDAQVQAMEQEKSNHELRRQIFEAKNKLGIPIDAADSAG
ncbi:MAG TPA: hypothetical protein VLM37_12185, partial [Fibrobacteraceae bacterium]|nr:hypothetical protein [Fibrobacteraceae bacterium]